MNKLVFNERQKEILDFMVLSNLENSLVASMDPESAPFSTQELKEFCTFLGLADEYEAKVPYKELLKFLI